MIAIPLALLFLFGAPQQSAPQEPDSARQQRLAEAKQKYEPTRQAAIHVNELAGNIHSESDARAFVDAVEERLTGHQRPSWITRGIRHRIAHAEYAAVSDPSRLIPEQRIVDVWNEYVREIDAPGETLITVAVLHNLRDAMYTTSQSLWKREGFMQQLWTVPNVYAVNADGKVADGCRAVEALKLLHDLFNSFLSVRGARERVQKGILVSETVKQREQAPTPRPQIERGELMAIKNANPLPAAEIRYVQAHGERDYRHLLMRLFEELFPSE